jgi:hypothetical protein
MADLTCTKLGVLLALTLTAACASSTSGSATSTGSTSTHSHTITTTQSTSTATLSGSGGAGGMGGSPSCNPPPDTGSLWATTAMQFGATDPTSMCDYRGDVLLIVNTADV